MPSVDSALSAWLKAERLDVVVGSTGFDWGDERTVEVEYLSPMDEKADAQAEAARHMDFLQGPTLKEIVIVKGRRRDLMGKVVTVSHDRIGYVVEGRLVLVIGVAENPENGTTALTVLRRVTPPEFVLLLEGSPQVSGNDGILLEGAAQVSGNDVLTFYGDE